MKWRSTPIAMMLLLATVFHTTGAADLPGRLGDPGEGPEWLRLAIATAEACPVGIWEAEANVEELITHMSLGPSSAALLREALHSLRDRNRVNTRQEIRPVEPTVESEQVAQTAESLSEKRVFEVGDKVEARYEARQLGTWYNATISQINDDGSYLLTWFEGDEEDRIKTLRKSDGLEQIRYRFGVDSYGVDTSLPFKIGDKVEARFIIGHWLKATISECNQDGSYVLTWDSKYHDRDRVKTAEKIRIDSVAQAAAKAAAKAAAEASRMKEVRRQRTHATISTFAHAVTDAMRNAIDDNFFIAINSLGMRGTFTAMQTDPDFSEKNWIERRDDRLKVMRTVSAAFEEGQISSTTRSSLEDTIRSHLAGEVLVKHVEQEIQNSSSDEDKCRLRPITPAEAEWASLSMMLDALKTALATSADSNEEELAAAGEWSDGPGPYEHQELIDGWRDAWWEAIAEASPLADLAEEEGPAGPESGAGQPPSDGPSDEPPRIRRLLPCYDPVYIAARRRREALRNKEEKEAARLAKLYQEWYMEWSSPAAVERRAKKRREAAERAAKLQREREAVERREAQREAEYQRRLLEAEQFEQRQQRIAEELERIERAEAEARRDAYRPQYERQQMRH